MDSRHESLTQEISNEVIQFINKYIQENIDEIVGEEELCEDMKEITKYLYSYADIPVDVESILSKKNFLSIDTVFLPEINDHALPKPKNSNEYFQFIEEMKTLISTKTSEEHPEFYQHILNILSRYHS